MVELTGVAHFAIPVSDPERSTRFYTEIVGCKLLHALPDKSMTFSTLAACACCSSSGLRPSSGSSKVPMGCTMPSCLPRTIIGRPSTTCGPMASRSSSRKTARAGSSMVRAVFPRSGRHCLGVHQPHSLRREDVNQRPQRRGGRFSLLFLNGCPYEDGTANSDRKASREK